MAAEVLENYEKIRAFHKKWLKSWEELGARILKFPDWLQTIILEDVHTAVQNRVGTMEMILESMKNKGKGK
jgi:hypothetical protein